jgi:nicotinate-nucleotide pyrophosphorylase (carboxylating)
LAKTLHIFWGAVRGSINEIIARALAEDVGERDVTTEATVLAQARAKAMITQKAPGVVFGLSVAVQTFRALDPELEIARHVEEGVWRELGGPVLEIQGLARPILTAERTALNFLQRLSGVATLTARFVRAVEGTGAQILDTRKTTPGLRSLEKAAVAAGGGKNHRSGLYDAVLIKENHAALAGGVGEAVRRARERARGLHIEVECRSIEEVDEALEARADRILLDNMTAAQLRAAAAHAGGRAELEASGGVSLETIREIAQCGLQFISVGALTHSAPSLDLSLILTPLP